MNPLRKKIQDSFFHLDTLIKVYERINPDTFVSNYFEDLKNRINLHQQELIKEINKKSNELKEILNEKEQKCKLNLNKIKKSNLEKLKFDLPICEYLLRTPDLNREELNFLSYKMNEKIKLVLNETKDYEYNLLMNESILFNKCDQSCLFGELEMKQNNSLFSLFPFQNSNELIKSFNHHYDMINSIQYDIKSNRLISASNDKTIKIWNFKTGDCLKTLNEHQDSVTSILIISNNKLISGSSDKLIKIWDLITYKCLNTSRNEFGITFLCLISANKIACGCQDGSIQILNVDNFIKVKLFKAHVDRITCLLSVADESILISCSGNKDKKIKIWNTKTFEWIKSLEGHSDTIHTYLDLSPSGGCFLSSSIDGKVILWQIETGELLKLIQFKVAVNCVQWVNDDLFLVGLDSGEIHIYNLKTMKTVRTISAHSINVNRISLLSDCYLLSGSGDGEIKLLKFLG